MSRTTPPRTWPATLLAIALLAPSFAYAQDEEPLRLLLDETEGRVGLELGEILAAGRIRQSLESGLPIRIEVRTELWRDRFFDSQEGREDWRATVWYEPLSGTYRVETEDTPVGLATSPEAATELLRSEVRSELSPTEPGTYYYLG